MATSKCPKCENSRFEAKKVKMIDGKTEYVFIQCYECGCVVGVSDITSLMNVSNIILGAVQDLRMRQ